MSEQEKKVVIYLLFCYAFGICSLVGRRKTVHKLDKKYTFVAKWAHIFRGQVHGLRSNEDSP